MDDGQVFDMIQTVGLLALAVVGAIVVIMLVISIADRHPPRKREHSRPTEHTPPDEPIDPPPSHHE